MIKKNSVIYHETVLINEVVKELHVNKSSQHIDATAGNGGHMLEIMRHGGRVLGIEIDPQMVAIAESRLKEDGGDYKLVNGNFKNIDKIAQDNDFTNVGGILFDLGVTNIHLKDPQRGFSFENPQADLDMRIDPDIKGVKASDLLNVLREDQLRELFELTLGSGPAKWLAGRTLHSRQIKPIKTVGDLLEISRGLVTGKTGLNQATLPFLALRIAVNSELDNLIEALPKAYGLLEDGGRLVVISFHSGEDKIVKDFFRRMSHEGASVITFKPIMASPFEIESNRRSRSAKMRVLEKNKK